VNIGEFSASATCYAGSMAEFGQDRTFRIVIMTNSKKQEYCLICGRLLDSPADPLSGSCGGDCWGCVGAIEAETGCKESLAYVRKEYELGLRPGWIDPFKS
jgi:hypothetical protein